MSVKITMEFANIDLAILALGKLAGGKPARAAETEPAPTVDATKAPRRGRSDKGKPRKGTRSETGLSPQEDKDLHDAKVNREDDAARQALQDTRIATTPAPAEADKAQPSGEVPGVVATEAEAQKALEKLFETAPPVGGLESAQAILKTFGVARVRDLKEEQRGPFVAAVDAVLQAAEKVVN